MRSELTLCAPDVGSIWSILRLGGANPVSVEPLSDLSAPRECNLSADQRRRGEESGQEGSRGVLLVLCHS